MSKHNISIFVIRYKWDIIQIHWIEDEYAICQVNKSYPTHKNYIEWEAKDLVWQYWDLCVSIEKIDIEYK